MRTSIKLFVVVVLATFALQSFAQKLEPVYSVVRQIHDFDWYEQQAKAWKQEIDNGTKNNMAWVYWYLANRNAGRFCDYKKWESKQGEYFLSRTKFIEMAEKAIPNSFEFYYLKTFDDNAGAASKSSAEFMLKAQAIRPFDRLLLPLLMNYYHFQYDKMNLELTAKKWFESNEMPQEMMITAYNNLVSLDTNAILIVNGDNDTYPSWVLQYSQNIRPDVLVLNLSLATYVDEYRNNVFKQNGILPITFKNDSTDHTKLLFKHLVTTIKNRPIYVSAFTGSDVYKEFENKMYFVGLSYKYNSKPFNNLAVLQNNVENKYLLDFLKRTFYNNPAQSVCKKMNAGYVASFVKLADYYKQSGNLEKSRKMKELGKFVAKDSGYTDWINYFEK